MRFRRHSESDDSMDTIRRNSTNYNDPEDQIQRRMTSNSSIHSSPSHSIEDDENNYSTFNL